MTDQPNYANVNGIRIAYERTGSGFPMILLHGFPRNRNVWTKVTPALAQRFTIVAPDRRGYGDSDRPDDMKAYDNAHMVADVLALGKELGLGQFIIVGHDKGAPTAQRLAVNHPDVVRAMVLLDGAPAGLRSQAGRDTTGRSWYMDFFRQRGVAEQIVGQNPRLFFSLFLDRNPHLPPEEKEYYLETFCRPGTYQAVIADYRSSLEEDREQWEEEAKAGRTIKVPVLALWGSRGPSANTPVLDLWKQAAADVRGEPVPDSAHYVMEEQPAFIIEKILKFADELKL